MNNDLISREALKKAIEPYRYATDGVFEGISLIIDNAPTVETYTKDDMTREYLKGYNACKDMNERPQGERIISVDSEEEARALSKTNPNLMIIFPTNEKEWRQRTTNEEAIEILKGYKQRLENSCSNVLDEDIKALDLAIKALEERPQGEWVPVGERLPDYMEDTLVTIQVNNREPKVRSGFYARGCFHNDNGDTWNWNDTEVKAWMPSPEPYKEEENVEE